MIDGASESSGTAGLINRTLPRFAHRFSLKPMPGHDARQAPSAFEIVPVGKDIELRGSSERAHAAAFGWYLRHIATCDTSWDRGPILLPELPVLDAPIRRAPIVDHFYYLNYVTFSYTIAFWDWDRWEREIDWMALHGIDMPLAITGQEMVWQRVLHRLGVPIEELDNFLVGPAFLPFGWLGVMDGWGGPLPEGWIENHADLQRRILERERSLGMTPVLQGFLGHVPRGFEELFPDNHFRHAKLSSFPATVMIDPADPLFIEIGTMFIEEQTSLYGTDHYYAVDRFQENDQIPGDDVDVNELAQALLRAMTNADPEARWVLQSWPFQTSQKFWTAERFQSFLNAVPDDRMIVLDLWAEQKPMWPETGAFHDTAWMWCVLHDFGGRQGLHGDIDDIATGLANATTSSHSGKLVGAGITAEAIDQNPIVYQLVADAVWSPEPPDAEHWLTGEIRRRYGVDDPAARHAWRLLHETVYSRHDPYMTDRHRIICQRPDAEVLLGITFDTVVPESELVALSKALGSLLGVKAAANCQPALRRDIVDVGHQLIASRAMAVFNRVCQTYRSGATAECLQAGHVFVQMLEDLDRLAATHQTFLLGNWIASARHWGRTPSDRDHLERNARLLVTLWSWAGSTLNDYSGRFWSGLLNDFHAQRWRMFLSFLDTRDATGPMTGFKATLFAWEEQWVLDTTPFPTSPTGDTLTIAHELLATYGVQNGKDRTAT